MYDLLKESFSDVLIVIAGEKKCVEIKLVSGRFWKFFFGVLKNAWYHCKSFDQTDTQTVHNLIVWFTEFIYISPSWKQLVRWDILRARVGFTID